jgi:CDP-diglyceride synthetase
VLGLLRAWGGAIFVLLIGMVTLAGLTPRLSPGEPMSASDQAFRVHLPWIVMTLLMVVVAALLHWQPSSTRRTLLATLPVPALGVLASAVIGAAGATSALTSLLYVVEGILGAAAGLFITSLFGKTPDSAAYPYPG